MVIIKYDKYYNYNESQKFLVCKSAARWQA